MVTTPQDVSLQAVERGLAMFEKVDVDVIGISSLATDHLLMPQVVAALHEAGYAKSTAKPTGAMATPWRGARMTTEKAASIQRIKDSVEMVESATREGYAATDIYWALVDWAWAHRN